MANSLWRCQVNNRLTRPADAPLPHPRDRQRQLSAQELNQQPEGDERKEKGQNLSHNQAIRVGQFSVQIPGQYWVQINSTTVSASAAEQATAAIMTTIFRIGAPLYGLNVLTIDHYWGVAQSKIFQLDQRDGIISEPQHE
jgi:hypothetical protein